MRLQEKLDALNGELASKIPSQALSVMHRVTEGLIASGQAERALRAGDRAPAFTLIDTSGIPVSSPELLKKGPLIVTFYRGVWCPFCNLDLQALESVAADIRFRGGSLVAISQQTPANNQKARQANHLGFPVLSDPGGDLASDFGVRWSLPDDLQHIYSTMGADLPAFNGEASWTLPMPARYVIGQDGVIAYAEISPDYTRRPEPRELLPVLDRLKSALYV